MLSMVFESRNPELGPWITSNGIIMGKVVNSPFDIYFDPFNLHYYRPKTGETIDLRRINVSFLDRSSEIVSAEKSRGKIDYDCGGIRIIAEKCAFVRNEDGSVASMITGRENKLYAYRITQFGLIEEPITIGSNFTEVDAELQFKRIQ